MKWLIVSALIVIAVSFVALRFRIQLQTALHLWRMFRQIKKASKPAPEEKKIENFDAGKSEPLVRCARCGKWITEASALKLRSKTVYCSADCMEKAARIESLVDRS